MPGLEENIKDFAKKAGAALVGVAGPDRMDGPASLDPGFIMPGGKSIVSMGDMWALKRWQFKKNYSLDKYIGSLTQMILGLINCT